MALFFLVSGLLLLSAYLLGSIPNGYLLGRALKGIDIREHGSGSTGATNVLRTVGKGAALAVLLLDAAKGALSVALIDGCYTFYPQWLPPGWQPWLATAAAFTAIVGHSKSIWINFTGGKSVATGLGVLLVMSPLVAGGTLAVFIIVLALTRIVSLSSIAAAIAVNLWLIALHQPIPYLLFGGIAGTYVILRHRSNIERLLAGTEPKIGQKLTQE
ncbi:MAG: glycerol-3-phosphate 1-O-acyltransferase PlsY [Cyanophyceae cyanobacterium]